MDQLWCDKYRPQGLPDLSYHFDITNLLSALSQSDDFPHMLFYGPNGAGKKTRILSFLQSVYGPGVYKLKSEEKEFKISDKSSTTAECSIISSNYHIDVTPSDAEHHDRVIISKLIKEVASTH